MIPYLFPARSLAAAALAAALLAACSAIPAVAVGEQLPNLVAPGGEKVEPRFKVTDRTWPAEPGDAEICLWKDDKLAAISVTVDDNCAPDVPWWVEMGEKYKFPVTWFIITDRIGTDARAFGGTWDLWRGVLEKGHDVQSHTHTHLHVELPDWKDIEWEYAESKTLLEKNLPGHRIRFLAYPGGKNSGKNDRSVAAKYYNGARGVSGVIPGPHVVDYMGTRCGSESVLNTPAGEKGDWADPANILNPQHKAYRGWCILLYHFMKDATKSTEPRPIFVFFEQNRDNLWISKFGDTSLYGQERDTATLKVTEKSDAKIVFDLTDRMDDAAFDFPLTIKVCVPAAWKEAAATQAGKPAGVQMVEHEGKRYALVQAVPDRGAVTLTGK
ncbi:hypothetical protein DB346_15845 [Verrucomicrobia bacterium LW23]|nr:hypothetical protein DB346_15845 [Verrucomicrobia bacterium LW23]